MVKELRDFGFAPYESFEQGVQESKKFVEGGLARVLEYAKNKVAPKLKEITDNYPEVDVCGFGSVSEPVETVSALYGGWGLDGRLDVYGDWSDVDNGLSFGVLTQKKNK